VAKERGEPLRRRYAGRGLAAGDFDNDGDADLLLLNVGARPVLLRNDGGNRRHWLGVALEGRRGSRDAVGARVTLVAGPLRQTRSVLGGTSYCSASDRRLLFGLADASRVDRLEVEWPGGGRTLLEGLRSDRYVSVRE
jgi:enediyne biosynthesis protein E4